MTGHGSVPSNYTLQGQAEIEGACRAVATHFNGVLGAWAYYAFAWVNRTLFFGELPPTLILWTLTPYGHTLGQARSPMETRQEQFRIEGAPIIQLHPALIYPRENPWGVPKQWLGFRYALDVLIHECIHPSVTCRLQQHYTDSHNNPAWISEVQRIAPLIGLQGVAFSVSKPKRIPIEGEVTVTGKTLTTVKRCVEAGAVPYECVYGFPHAVRKLLGTADGYYTGQGMPWENGDGPVTYNWK